MSQSAFTFSDPKLLAGLYSNVSFRSLCSPRVESSKWIENLYEVLNFNPKGQTLRSLLETGYNELLQKYRHEYLFKSALFKDFILENYALESAIFLNEFKIGKSIADAVLVNGTSKVFEIKTELDSPVRLDSQIKDYKKAFSEVYLVVHDKQVEKYRAIVPSEIGLLCFSEESGFLEYRIARPDNSKLEIVAMVKSMRKEELRSLAIGLTGEIPIATPVKLFNTCLGIVNCFPPEQVQREYLQIIKRRINPAVNEKLHSDQIPSFLKFFCYTENINEKEYIHLINSLDITF